MIDEANDMEAVGHEACIGKMQPHQSWHSRCDE